MMDTKQPRSCSDEALGHLLRSTCGTALKAPVPPGLVNRIMQKAEQQSQSGWRDWLSWKTTLIPVGAMAGLALILLLDWPVSDKALHTQKAQTPSVQFAQQSSIPAPAPQTDPATDLALWETEESYATEVDLQDGWNVITLADESQQTEVVLFYRES